MTLAQAAVGVILTVPVPLSQTGVVFARIIEALLGTGVAVVFSQLLFPPDPLRLVRRAEAATLRELSRSMSLTVNAMCQRDGAVARQALEALWQTHDHLPELDAARRVSSRVVRHSLTWRTRRDAVVRAHEDTVHLNFLVARCRTATRTALAAAEGDRRDWRR